MRHEIDWKSPVLANKRIARSEMLKKKRIKPAIYAVLASLGIFGGISALFIGLVFIVLHAVLMADTVFSRAGTVLLVVAIPMILLGSVFVDEIEGK